MKNILLEDESSVVEAMEAIKAGFENEKLHEVVVKKVKNKRKLLLNRLLWHWYNQISGQSESHGMLTEEVIEYCKLTYGVPILCQDDTDFCEMWTENFEDIFYNQKLLLVRYLPITSVMNNKQMLEYLTQMRIGWESQGIRLTDSNDIYNNFIGRKI